MRIAALLGLPALLAAVGASAAPIVQLEALTTVEVRERVAAGTATVLVPIGGTEQNGAHMVLGKHNVRARVLAERIAQRLGDALVAPVVAYVPEGSVEPPSGHMRWAGTVSVPQSAFEALLVGAARSFCSHGLRDVVFLGDHGGYQKSLERAAARVNRDAVGTRPCRAHALADYYRVTQTDYVAALKSRGFGADEIGTHAGLADTSLSMAVDPALVRGLDAPGVSTAGPVDGVMGDPRRSSADLGRLGVERIVDASVAAIRQARRHAGGAGGPGRTTKEAP